MGLVMARPVPWWPAVLMLLAGFAVGLVVLMLALMAVQAAGML